ncbi:hypothetical protein IEO21_00958 [Rhodonia placenta]|uniref:Uncharacterized protein n=1 Tax=Rhodonia placenta TaxID=104341 RepID=A0A8H7U5Y2_9APHY|nr:hypothetical protein IEO21_00958 [Postia placenta]
MMFYAQDFTTATRSSLASG